MRRIACLSLILASTPALAEEDGVPRIAVMSAFAPEWTTLRADLEDAATETINGTRFITGRLGGQNVVLFLSGVSMVNAAMNTQLALDNFDVEAIVFSGIAGGVNPDLHIGDVVIPAQWSEYLEGILARETDKGYQIPPFLTSELPNYGMIFTGPVEVASARGPDPEARYWFPADREMLRTAREITKEIVLDDCAEGCLEDQPRIIVGGNGVSGMSFLDNSDFRNFVFETFEANVVDMESAAVAHVAYANEVPFIAFRSLSDLAGGGGAENEMATFLSLAAENSAGVVTAFLRAIK